MEKDGDLIQEVTIMKIRTVNNTTAPHNEGLFLWILTNSGYRGILLQTL